MKSLQELRSSLLKKMESVYLLAIHDDLERQDGVDAILHKAGLGPGQVYLFEGEKTTVGELMAELNALSFLDGFRAVHLRGLDRVKVPVLKALESYLSRPNDSLVLILSAASLPGRHVLPRAIKGKGAYVQINEEKIWQKEKRLGQWLEGRARQMGVALKPDAANALVKYMGVDMQILQNELEKLVCYVGEKGQVNLADVQALCLPLNLSSVWELGDSILDRSPGKAIRAVHDLLLEGLTAQALLVTLRSQLQTALQVASILQQGGGEEQVQAQFPYMRGKILQRKMQQARQYGVESFWDALYQLFHCEVLSKSSLTETHLLLETLVTRLCRPQSRLGCG